MLLSVVRDTFARIHWRHDFSRRPGRVALNDNPIEHARRDRAERLGPVSTPVHFAEVDHAAQ